MGVRKAYGQAFGQLRATLEEAQALANEIQGMLAAAFRQLNADYGFALQPPPPPDLSAFVRDIETIERNHMQYLGIANTLRLTQTGFAARLLQALLARLRTVFKSALGAVELWSKAANTQLDGQVHDRRDSFSRRVDAIVRIQQAAEGLDERIGQIEQQEELLREFDVKLIQLTSPMLAVNATDSELRHAA